MRDRLQQLTWLIKVDDQQIILILDYIKCLISQRGYQALWDNNGLGFQN